MAQYSARRRHGRRGYFGLMRGEVLDQSGSPVIETRSAQLAEVIARLLNGQSVEQSDVEDRASLPRYQLSHGMRGRQCAIVGIESSVRDSSRFGDGFLAATDDEVLAAKVAQMLNEVDPRRRPRVQRGFGWW